MTGHSLFAGVDRAVFAASFAERLRSAGLPVSLTTVERCAASLDAVSLSTANMYWVLRLNFVTRHHDIAVFDAVFDAVFGALPNVEMGFVAAGAASRPTPDRPDHDDDLLVSVHRESSGMAATSELPWATLPTFGEDDDGDDPGDDLAVPDVQPSLIAADMDRPFDLLDDDELERVGSRLEEQVTSWPRRRSRRRMPSTHGSVAMRRTMRRAMRTGGEVLALSRVQVQTRPRPVVVLLDVSGSMEAYARIYLHLIRPLAIAQRAEVFAFATELHRVTPAVRRRTAAEAIEAMNDSVGDRFTGTRLASSISTLLRHRTWSTATRGAVVLICSDGWDADEPEALDRAMQRLALRAHRIVWVNPRSAADGFEPLTRGMSTAHPYCDTFLAGNTARSMVDVVSALST